jgi:repressor LexA
MKDLTENQKVVYSVLRDIIRKGEVPTLTYLAAILEDKIKISSLNSIVQYLKSLERKGYIYREKNKKGGIMLREDEQALFDENFFEIPLIGMANCGAPNIFAEENLEGKIKVSKRLLNNTRPEGVFMVRVNGSSMNKRGLRDGDYAIIKHIDHAGPVGNGDVVLAIVNGLATIKTFFKSADAIILRPESTFSHHQPIFLHPDDDLFINGKLVGVFKNG